MTPPLSRGARAPIRAAASAAVLVAASLAAPPADAQRFPEFRDPRLAQGRATWLGTCEACHAHDVAGAPLVTDRSAWAARLGKGRAALYRSALSGTSGPQGTEMPPRGGNPALSDDQVKAAVDYMVAIVPK